jgi:hypothetical protein
VPVEMIRSETGNAASPDPEILNFGSVPERNDYNFISYYFPCLQ